MPVTVVPANEASWEDLRAIFGDRGYAAFCQCWGPSAPAGARPQPAGASRARILAGRDYAT